jgi:hypothetical protein
LAGGAEKNLFGILQNVIKRELAATELEAGLDAFGGGDHRYILFPYIKML